MKLNTSQTLEAPEIQMSVGALIYCVPCFFSLPFLLLLFSAGSEENYLALSWLEIVFHAMNLFVVVGIFREYLSDSFLNVQIETKQVLRYAGLGAVLILAVSLVWMDLYRNTGLDQLLLAAYGTLPVSEMDILVLSADVIYGNPIFGTLCMVLVAPVVTCCLYYATVFPGLCEKRVWLAYLAVALVTAFPRLCNGMTFWDPGEEFLLYLSRLPLHLICCWTYQKTDTIWAPIFAQAAANLVCCLQLAFMFQQ